jgi:hypothetical protein
MAASTHESVMNRVVNRVVQVLLEVPYSIRDFGQKKAAGVNGRYPGGEESGSGSVWQFQKDDHRSESTEVVAEWDYLEPQEHDVLIHSHLEDPNVLLSYQNLNQGFPSSGAITI